MMSAWVDIQLNDNINNNSGNGETVTESDTANNNNGNNAELKYDRSGSVCDECDQYVIQSNSNNNSNYNYTTKCSNSNEDVAAISPPISPASDSIVGENRFNYDCVDCNAPKRGRIGSMVDELLNEIYCNLRGYRNRGYSYSSDTSNYSTPEFYKKPPIRRVYLKAKGISELKELREYLGNDVNTMNATLVHHLRRRDRLSSLRSQYYDIITAALQAISPKRSVDTKMRFSIEPYPGDSGFSQWHDAMRMVSRLPGGIPQEFRKKLWITLAERHVQTRKVNWSVTSRFCFNEKGNPDDEALGAQIVKDLHRTGCSLFSGEELHNQALLKQVLLAYARWNKSVGYCQGFNMLAAIILEVMEGNVEDSLKVMIYLIEGVLPESYFANNLRGLSVDMAVFRDLLRMRLSSLAKHFDKLQYEAQDSSTGASYEPPLINVFTMQWFLTLFSNCLPKSSVLRIWDLIFLEGNEVLLRTALAIWDCLADRILTVESADEFYSIMGVLTREMMEFGVPDTNELVKTICIMAPFPFPQLGELREKYIYNIRPLTSSFALVKKGLQIFQSDDEDDADAADDQIMVANWCLTNAFNAPKSKEQSNSGSRTPSPSSANSSLGSSIGSTAITVGNVTANFLSANNIDPQRMTLDISLLKKQYAKLKERQQQAQVILTEGFQHASQHNSKKEPVAMNHLLMGKTALTTKRPKRPSPVIQSATRDNFDPKKAFQNNRSNTVANLFAHKPRNSSQKKDYRSHHLQVRKENSDSTAVSVETLSWSQVKLERRRKKFQRKLSEPVLNTLSMSKSKESSNGHFVKSNDSNDNDIPLTKDDCFAVNAKKQITLESNNNSSDDDSTSFSSSSTELCDDEHMHDSDFPSSPEVSRRPVQSMADIPTQSTICENQVMPQNINTNVDYLSNESANKCLTSDNNSCDKSRLSSETVYNANIIEQSADACVVDNDAYDIIKRDISELSLEEFTKKLNEKMSFLNEDQLNKF